MLTVIPREIAIKYTASQISIHSFQVMFLKHHEIFGKENGKYHTSNIISSTLMNQEILIKLIKGNSCDVIFDLTLKSLHCVKCVVGYIIPTMMHQQVNRFSNIFRF